MTNDGRIRTEAEQYARLDQLFTRDRDAARKGGDEGLADDIEAARLRAARH